MSQTLQVLLDGNGQRATDNAIIDRAAERIGCEPVVLHVILEVESKGEPYDAKGRLVILPEKHVFWRELPKTLRAKAQALGLATPHWSRKNYSDLGGIGSDKRWDRLERMVKLDETAGFRSASYGAPQIMGFNHLLCGFATVTAFVLAFARSEVHQQEAFVAFVEAVGLADDLRERDFDAVERRFNGGGQGGAYAARMRDLYEAMSGQKWELSESRSGTLRLGSSGYRVRALQQRLVALGYHVHEDGDFGPAVRRAVVAFQVDHGLKPDGVVGPKTEAALDKAVPIAAQPGNSRDDLTVADLRDRGSETVKQADNLTKVGGAVTVTGILAQLADQAGPLEKLGGVFGQVGGLLDQARPLVAFVASNKWIALVVIGGLVIFIARRIKLRRLFDAKTWRHVG